MEEAEAILAEANRAHAIRTMRRFRRRRARARLGSRYRLAFAPSWKRRPRRYRDDMYPSLRELRDLDLPLLLPGDPLPSPGAYRPLSAFAMYWREDGTPIADTNEGRDYFANVVHGPRRGAR